MKKKTSSRARQRAREIRAEIGLPGPATHKNEITDDELVDLMTQEYDRQKAEEELVILSQALREERAELGRKNFWYFLTKILFPTIWKEHYTEEFHKPFCDALQNLGPGDDFWGFLSRGSRKSYLVTIAHSLWLIIRDPDIRILLVGAREETVKPFARVIISAFLPDTPGFETLRETYPEFVIHEKGRHILQAFQFTHPLRKKVLPDPTFRATYVGVTGAGWRCDVLKYDDCVEMRNVTTPEMAAKTLRQMLMLTPLVDIRSPYRNTYGVGTRYSHIDPYGRFLGEQSDEEAFEEIRQEVPETTNIMVRHAMELPDKLCEACPPHVVKRYPHGHPSIAPEAEVVMAPIHTREDLLKELEKYMRDPKLGEAMWWNQYMNVTMAPSQQKIKPDWFIRAHFPKWPAPRRKIIALDDASKDFQKIGTGDYSVAVFAEYDDTGRLIIVDGLRSKSWTKDEFIREILTWCLKRGWWPHFVAKEKASVDSFLSDLRRAFENESRPVHTRPITLGPGSKKIDRIVGNVQGPLERAELIFGSSCSPNFFAQAKYELTNIAQAAHDDVADAISLLFAEEVRYIGVPDMGGDTFEWQAPDMDNMDVFEVRQRPKPAPSRGPWDQAAASERVERAFEGFGMDEDYDPFNPPEGSSHFEPPAIDISDLE